MRRALALALLAACRGAADPASPEPTPADAAPPAPPDLRQVVRDVIGDVVVMTFAAGTDDYRDVVDDAAGERGLALPFVLSEVTARAGDREATVAIRGEALPRTPIGRYLASGELPARDRDDVVDLALGTRIAQRLDVWVGDRLALEAPRIDLESFRQAAPARFTARVVGIVDTASVYDDRMAWTSLEAGQRVVFGRDRATGVALRLADPDDAAAAKARLAAALGDPYVVQDQCDLNPDTMGCR